MAPQGADRRKFARLDLALSVGYQVIGRSGGVTNPADAVSQDISLGGLRLMTPTPLENGTQLELQIQLSETELPITASAEVVWQTKLSTTSYETGVLIKGMPHTDRSRFMAFVFDQMAKVVATATH